jgi:hypothetical protein
MAHICKDNWHASKELVSACKNQFQRRTADRDHDIWLSRRVPCAQVAHQIVPILSRRETREIEVFRENFHVFRPPTRQAGHQALVRHFHGRDGQPITVEHFFYAGQEILFATDWVALRLASRLRRQESPLNWKLLLHNRDQTVEHSEMSD